MFFSWQTSRIGLPPSTSLSVRIFSSVVCRFPFSVCAFLSGPRLSLQVAQLGEVRSGWISQEEFTDGEAWFRAQDVDRNGRLERRDWDAMSDLMKRGENALLAIKPGGRGDISATHVAWRQTRGLPYVPSPLHYGGRLYLIRDGGMMSSFDARTGEPFYQQERIGTVGSYYASPVAADGRIYVLSLDGGLSVIRAGGDRPEVLHTADFGERIAATPAMVGNRMYLRTRSKLYAFGEVQKR